MIMKIGPLYIIASLFLLISFASCSSGSRFSLRENAPSITSVPKKSGHLPVNGIDIYYEIHGSDEGVPLVLLNGGGSNIEVTYGRILPLFAQHRKVIALDEQAHGRTSDRNAPVRFDSSADDVAGLLKQLKIEKADVFGFSNGASVALQLTLRHPKLVRKLVFASSMTKKSGAPPQFWDFMKKATFESMPQPLKDSFLKVNPDPKKLHTMYEKDVNRMLNFRDTSDREVKSVKAPTLIISGDRDVGTLEHAAELTRLISGSRLIVLPSGHGEYLGEILTVSGTRTRYPELTAALVEEFLDEKSN